MENKQSLFEAPPYGSVTRADLSPHKFCEKTRLSPGFFAFKAGSLSKLVSTCIFLRLCHYWAEYPLLFLNILPTVFLHFLKNPLDNCAIYENVNFKQGDKMDVVFSIRRFIGVLLYACSSHSILLATLWFSCYLQVQLSWYVNWNCLEIAVARCPA